MNTRRLTEADRREELLLFGREHFAAHAFDAQPMREIAERAQVSKGLLYHYFGGRRGFYLATVTHVIDGLLDAMKTARDANDNQRFGLITGFVRYVKENAEIYQALVRGGLGADPEIGAQLDRVKEFGIEAIVGSSVLPLLSPLARLKMVGWIAWVEAATSAWLETDDIKESEFIDAVVSALTAALPTLLEDTK